MNGRGKESGEREREGIWRERERKRGKKRKNGVDYDITRGEGMDRQVALETET